MMAATIGWAMYLLLGPGHLSGGSVLRGYNDRTGDPNDVPASSRHRYPHSALHSGWKQKKKLSTVWFGSQVSLQRWL